MKRWILWTIIAGTAIAGTALGTTGYGADYYLAPAGSDANAGTAAAPWKTFAYALPRLDPGDTLILKDGVYGIAAGSGPIYVDGATTHKNGTADRRITVKAEHERQAVFEGTGRGFEFYVLNCSYWTFEGLSVKSNDANVSGPAAGSTGHPIHLYKCSRIIVRRNLLYRTNRYENDALLLLHRTSHSLVEENEGYAFHRHGMSVARGDHNTFRRNYLHSRLAKDIPPDGIQSGAPGRGDGGITIYPGSYNVVENNIVEKVGCGYGIEATADSIGNRFYGNISLDNLAGMQFNARGKTLTTMPRETVVEHFVGLNTSYYGIYLRGTKDTHCTNCTVLHSNVGGFAADRPSLAGDDAPTVFFRNCLAAFNKSYGFNLADQAEYAIGYSNAFGQSVGFSPQTTDARISDESTLDPGLGRCVLFIPEGSPMKGAGAGGEDIGANVLYQYRDGSLTNEPLWDPRTGEFPHGAILAGVNDVPGSSCFDVHQRLDVSAATLPPEYGAGTGDLPNVVESEYLFPAQVGRYVKVAFTSAYSSYCFVRELTFSALHTAAGGRYASSPFRIPTGIPTMKGAGGIGVADLNGDGLFDYLVSYRDTGEGYYAPEDRHYGGKGIGPTTVEAYDHDGGRLWRLVIDLPIHGSAGFGGAGGHAKGFSTADVDGDGKSEVVHLDSNNQIIVRSGTSGQVQETISVSAPAGKSWGLVQVVNLRDNGDRDAILQANPVYQLIDGGWRNVGSNSLTGVSLETGQVLWTYDSYVGAKHGGFRAADIDADGRDEVYGVTLVDHDGTPLNSWTYPLTININAPHINAVHALDVQPQSPGLEVVLTEEIWADAANAHRPDCVSLVNPGHIRWRKSTGILPQNVAVGDFDLSSPGLEIWCRSNLFLWQDATGGQTPWVFDSAGNVLTTYRLNDTKPANWSTNGIEVINPIAWNSSGPQILAAKERNIEGELAKLALVDPMSGTFVKVWTDEAAARLLVADVSGDAREEAIVFNQTTRELRIYFNEAKGAGSPQRLWRHNWYRRAKDNSNYYSP